MHADQASQIEKALSSYSPEAQAHTRVILGTLENLNASIAPPIVSLLAASYDAGAGNITGIELRSPAPETQGMPNVIAFAEAAARIRQRRAMAHAT